MNTSKLKDLFKSKKVLRLETMNENLKKVNLQYLRELMERQCDLIKQQNLIKDYREKIESLEERLKKGEEINQSSINLIIGRKTNNAELIRRIEKSTLTINQGINYGKRR